MVGTICIRDILFHPFVTIRAFGWRVFFRAIFESHDDTFLSLLQRDGLFAAPSASNEPDLIERCVQLELQSAAIYHSLARRFADSVPLREFLKELAEQEQGHADLLRVCKMFAAQGRFVANAFSPWHDYVPLLEQQMQQIVASLDQIGSVDDVVRLVIHIETSEINPVFMRLIGATDSPFVKKLGHFVGP